MNVITLLAGNPYTFNSQLTLTVLDIIEEWLGPNRRSVMIVTLRMQKTKLDQTIQLTSDEPILNWMGYQFEYIGGWRDEVRLKQIKIEKIRCKTRPCLLIQ